MNQLMKHLILHMDVNMKLRLNKKKLKNLSKDNEQLLAEMTVQVAGGGAGRGDDYSNFCNTINAQTCQCESRFCG